MSSSLQDRMLVALLSDEATDLEVAERLDWKEPSLFTIYKELRSLEYAGLMASSRGTIDGGPQRTRYRLTRAGCARVSRAPLTTLHTSVRAFHWLLLATCAAAGLAAAGVPYAGPASAILFCALSLSALVVLRRVP